MVAPLGCSEWVEESERKGWRESDRGREGGSHVRSHVRRSGKKKWAVAAG